jgi:hypothetical protein
MRLLLCGNKDVYDITQYTQPNNMYEFVRIEHAIKSGKKPLLSRWMDFSDNTNPVHDDFTGHTVIVNFRYDEDLSYIFSPLHKSKSITILYNDYLIGNINREYVTFPDGVTYKGTCYPSNGVYYNWITMDLEDLQYDFVCYHNCLTEMDLGVIKGKCKNIILNCEISPEDHKQLKKEITRFSGWKSDAVVSLLTADLYEDDEYSWK